MTKHTSLAEAYAAAYAEMTEPPLDSTAQVGGARYAYTSLSGLLNHVRPILARHGLSLRHSTETDVIDGTRGTVTAAAVIEHESAFDKAITSSVTVPVEAMTKRDGTIINPGPQAYGIACTYARRYATYGVLGVGGETDNDGQAIRDAERPKPAPKPEPSPSTATAAQRKRLFAVVKSCGYGEAQLREAVRVVLGVESGSTATLTPAQIDTLIALAEAGELVDPPLSDAVLDDDEEKILRDAKSRTKSDDVVHNA